MTLPVTALDIICPLHAVVSPSGHLTRVGPTLNKLRPDRLKGRRFLEIFEVQRPRGLTNMKSLLAAEGRKLHLRFRDAPHTALKGVMVADGRGGGVVKFSFGISLVEAVNDYALSNRDFEPTDVSVEMLYLIEAKSTAMEATHTLNRRLEIARNAAEEQAFTDTLTGLRNRRALDGILTRLCATTRQFSLMHMDLDFFKAVNDTHGHAAGDHVLQETAHRMLQVVRREDTVARVGGDEFILIFEELVDRDVLADLTDRLIRKIEVPIEFGAITCKVSGSAGIASRRQGRKVTPEGLIAAADKALYEAKDAGRSCHRFAEEDDLGIPTFSAEMGLDPPRGAE